MRVSVLINTYQNGRYLAACIDSVLAQTEPVDEIIVADNESTDDTGAILARQAGRIVAVRTEHRERESGMQNQARAIDDAFRRATGEIVLLLDGDDAFLPEKVARVKAAFASDPRAVLVQSPLRIVDAAGRACSRPVEPFRHLAEPLETAYGRNELDFFYPTSALAFRRAFLATRLPLDLADGLGLAADNRLCLAALLAGRIVTLPDELGIWRCHAGSDSARERRSPFYRARLARQRARLFNVYCAAQGRPGISVWRSPLYYLRWLRGFFVAAARRGERRT